MVSGVMRLLAALALAAAALVAAAAPAGQLALEVSFTRQTGGFPPDTMGAVGPEHVVTLTNGGISVHRKSDGLLLDSAHLGAFWSDAGVSVSYPFDPRILFDPASGRFFAVALDGGSQTPNEILVAVSNDSDPTAGWTGFALDSDATDLAWADFPTIGVDADAVTIASDMHRVGQEGLPIGVDVLVAPKADLLAPAPSIAGATLFERVGIGKVGYAPQPVTRVDGGSAPIWLMSSAVAFLGVIQTARVTGTLDALAIAPGPFVLIDPLPVPPEAERPGGGFFDTGDGHFASLVQVGGSIWAVHAARGPSERAAIRWFELDAETAAVLQTGVIEDPDLDFLYPSIAANALGQVVIGYSASNATSGPSAYAVLGETVGGATVFGAPLLLWAGSDWFGGAGVSRFGDYSATVVDPSDAELFWTFQQVSGDDGTIAVAGVRVVPEPRAATPVACVALLLLACGRARMRRAAG